VLVVVSDAKIAVDNSGTIDYFEPNVLAWSDYFPFGMIMPGRSGGEDYRYGFNGKEQDPEVSGTGNQYDYGFRLYNPRLGKFLSVDPLEREFSFWSPYHFAGNSPVGNSDLDGLEPSGFLLEQMHQTGLIAKKAPPSLKPPWVGELPSDHGGWQYALHYRSDFTVRDARTAIYRGVGLSTIGQMAIILPEIRKVKLTQDHTIVDFDYKEQGTVTITRVSVETVVKLNYDKVVSVHQKVTTTEATYAVNDKGEINVMDSPGYVKETTTTSTVQLQDVPEQMAAIVQKAKQFNVDASDALVRKWDHDRSKGLKEGLQDLMDQSDLNRSSEETIDKAGN